MQELVADPLPHPARHRAHPNRAVPNSAPSVSESARQEHNRIFGYRPPGSSRQSGNSGCKSHATGRQAANASWSRSFICLASTGQFCPPSTSERIALTLNGLGEKKITFPKEGNAGDVHEKIIQCFPALRAGYELLRVGDGRSKDLLFIPMPENGFTVPYLKSVLGQAKGYLRPLQQDIPLVGREADADSDKVRSSHKFTWVLEATWRVVQILIIVVLDLHCNIANFVCAAL